MIENTTPTSPWSTLIFSFAGPGHGVHGPTNRFPKTGSSKVDMVWFSQIGSP